MLVRCTECWGAQSQSVGVAPNPRPQDQVEIIQGPGAQFLHMGLDSAGFLEPNPCMTEKRWHGGPRTWSQPMDWPMSLVWPTEQKGSSDIFKLHLFFKAEQINTPVMQRVLYSQAIYIALFVALGIPWAGASRWSLFLSCAFWLSPVLIHSPDKAKLLTLSQQNLKTKRLKGCIQELKQIENKYNLNISHLQLLMEIQWHPIFSFF